MINIGKFTKLLPQRVDEDIDCWNLWEEYETDLG